MLCVLFCRPFGPVVERRVSSLYYEKAAEGLIKCIGISKLCVERSDCFVRAKWHFALHQRKSRRRHILFVCDQCLLL